MLRCAQAADQLYRAMPCSTLPWPGARQASLHAARRHVGSAPVDIALAARELDDSLPRRHLGVTITLCPLSDAARCVAVPLPHRLAATPCWLAPGATSCCSPMVVHASNCIDIHCRFEPSHARAPVLAVAMTGRTFFP